MEKRILPSLMNWIGLETQKGWPLFWCLLGSRRSWMKRPSGQDKTGFIFCVRLQRTLCISDFWTLYALLKCTLKFPVLKVGVGANTFPQLYYCFPSPAQNYIQAYNKREKKKGKHPKPTQQTLVCSKMQILAAATKAEVQGLKQVCFQLRRSFASVRNPQQWDPTVQCLVKTRSVVKVMGLWKRRTIPLCPDYMIAQTIVWSSM